MIIAKGCLFYKCFWKFKKKEIESEISSVFVFDLFLLKSQTFSFVFISNSEIKQEKNVKSKKFDWPLLTGTPPVDGLFSSSCLSNSVSCKFSSNLISPAS